MARVYKFAQKEYGIASELITFFGQAIDSFTYNGIPVMGQGGDIVVSTNMGNSPNNAGLSAATVDGDTTLTTQPADATHPGLISTGAQTFGGNKLFNGTVTSALSLNVPATTDSTHGIINVGSTRIHNYGVGSEKSIFIGEGAGNFSQTGDNNIGIGDQALANATTANSNVVIQQGASAITTGVGHTLIGSWANGLQGGIGCTAIGYRAGSAWDGNQGYNVAIAHTGDADSAKTINIGQADVGDPSTNRIIMECEQDFVVNSSDINCSLYNTGVYQLALFEGDGYLEEGGARNDNPEPITEPVRMGLFASGTGDTFFRTYPFGTAGGIVETTGQTCSATATQIGIGALSAANNQGVTVATNRFTLTQPGTYVFYVKVQFSAGPTEWTIQMRTGASGGGLSNAWPGSGITNSGTIGPGIYASHVFPSLHFTAPMAATDVDFTIQAQSFPALSFPDINTSGAILFTYEGHVDFETFGDY